MISELENYYLKIEEPNGGCLLALRDIILKQSAEITEHLKWGIPSFFYRNKIFCFLNLDKKTNSPYLMMADGRELHHPELEKGTRLRMKILRINPNKDIPLKMIEAILHDAIVLQKTKLR